MKPETGKTRIIFAVILGLVGFVTSFGAHIVAVNLPVYAKQFGFGVALIGLLIAVYDFAEIIAKPVFGAVADRTGMKKTMLLGILLFIFSSLLYLVINPRYLLLVRFLQGIGAAALSAVSLALVAEYYNENRGRAYGIYNAIKGSGYVISPIVGGLIVLKSNFASIFIASAAVGVVALLLSLALPEKGKVKKESFDDDDLSPKSLLSVFRDSRLSGWYLTIIINMFFVSILFGFLPVYINSLGYNPIVSGIFLSVVALSYLLVQPLAGRLADRGNAVPSIKLGLLASALCIILLPFTNGVSLIIVSIISGIGVGTVWTNTDAVVSKLAKEGKLGATMGAAGSFKEFGDMVGPVAIGLISQFFGLKAGFVSSGILGLIALAALGRKLGK